MKCQRCDCPNTTVVERDGTLLHTAGYPEGDASVSCPEWTAISADEVEEYREDGWTISRERGRIYAICPCDEPVIE